MLGVKDLFPRVVLSLCVPISLGICHSAIAQKSAPNQWTPVGGTSSMYQPGKYGTQGTPSASTVPGSRSQAATWVDGNGNLWMFGGFGVPSATPWGTLNDFWKYDTATSQWTWVSGSSTAGARGTYGTLGTPSSETIPGARYNGSSLTDKSGNFWLFGGLGVDSTGANGLLNDVWEFDPSSSQWTWKGGGNVSASSKTGVYGSMGTPASANIPGARESVASWVDQKGKFWFFGGLQFDSNSNSIYLNDLWSFDPSSNQWTWAAGPQASSTGPGASGVYGSKGTADIANLPGGRYSASTWVDASGNLWLFGGEGIDSKGATGMLNDLWEFNTSSSQWTWMGGTNTAASSGCTAGNYGTQGTAAATNLPGGRNGSTVWTDSYGRFWMFGGYGCDSAGKVGNLGDLWAFNPTKGQWTWMGGSNTVNSTGTLGPLGVASFSNIPASRSASAAWSTPDGKQWMFGGYFSEPNSQFNLYTDLWAFQTPSPNDSSTPTPAVMSSPAPNSQLTGSSATFSWSAGTGVSFYSLWIGTKGPGTTDVYDSGNLSSQSVNVSNLPTNGKLLFVRLFSWINNGWQWNDYTYTESSPTIANLTSPAPGSTLGGTTATFAWSAGTGVSAYSLWIGTKGPGSTDVYNSGNLTTQSAAVSNLPGTGQYVYVRLSSFVSGAWQFNDYIYTASGTAAASQITAPTAGSTLVGSTVTFSWTAGTGVTLNSLWVGTTGPGSANIFDSGNTTAHSATVSGLPETGQTIFVRLFSWIDGAWQTHDYTYIAASTPVAAVLTSPTPGSTLAGSSVTFSWTKGTTVQFYSLWVGTSGPGSSNVFDSGNVTTQSATVSGLPTAGQTVYVRLFSWINNAWQTSDYTYTAF